MHGGGVCISAHAVVGKPSWGVVMTSGRPTSVRRAGGAEVQQRSVC